MIIRDRIITYLQEHPEGVDDDDIADALNLKSRQQANIRCNRLKEEGFVIRRPVHGKIHNFWVGESPLPKSSTIKLPEIEPNPRFDDWFWEGNVQSKVIAFLVSINYHIRSVADTANHQQGVDIIAERDGKTLWVSVKGFPNGTERTKASIQASHWFKQAIFDILEYRERDKDVLLGVAFPDFPRYHNMANKITWLKPVARFRYIWVSENGNVVVE